MGVNQVKERCGMQETVDPTKTDKGKHQNFGYAPEQRTTSVDYDKKKQDQEVEVCREKGKEVDRFDA